MDDVFKALADPTRRLILDRLRKQDGQTLGELCAAFEMSRFGVMKHLRVLEDAHLVVTKKVGREKLHYLNRVPIRRIHDRWVSRYTAPLAAALVDLKSKLEAPPMSVGPTHVFEVFIRTTPERLWQAITDPEWTKQYFFGTAFHGKLEANRPMSYDFPDGRPAVTGEVLEVEPLKKLVTSWTFQYDPEMALERSKVTWLITPRGETCKLTAIHECTEAPKTGKHVVEEGWSYVLSAMKTLLETGVNLVVAPPEAPAAAT